MDRQMHDDRAFKQTTHKDHIEEVFPRGPLGPILGSPKQYEPPCRGGPHSYDGDGLNLNSDDDEKTKKEVY